MRYIAKIHILDVMDQVVVSGYVYDADPLTDPDHEVTEFSYSVPSFGLDDPQAWMLNALYRALVSRDAPLKQRRLEGRVDGGAHTVTGISDLVADLVGLTVVGGPGGEDVFRSQSDSAQEAGKPSRSDPPGAERGDEPIHGGRGDDGRRAVGGDDAGGSVEDLGGGRRH